MKRNTIVEIISTVFILLFAYTASSKLMDYSTFQLLLHFQPVINRIPMSMAWILPLGELAIMLMLLGKKTKMIALDGIIAISLFGIVYRIIILASGRHLPCLCGPYIRSMGEVKHVFFELATFTVAALAIVLTRFKQVKSGVKPNPLSYTANSY